MVRGEILEALDYCNHLYDKTTDGYIQIVKFNEDRTLKIFNTDNRYLREVVEELYGEDDSFIAVNTTYKPGRSVNNIRQFRALYIDLDIDEDRLGKQEAVYYVWEMAWREEIPFPSMVVDSGRGIHLYWRIKNAPYPAINTWQELEDYLYYKLKHLGADIRATDGARILRLPQTVNSKSNTVCKVIVLDDDKEYSMYELREQYLNYKPKPQQLEFQQVKKRQAVVTNYFNSYTLHTARAEDLLTLVELRNYNVTGYRNMIIHCYAYWTGIYIREEESLAKEVIDLNNSFREPLKETDIDAVLRCIPKAIEKFINYEQGIRSGEKKRVSKGMRDKEGYWYKNETLIERLNITREEQKHMKTIISTEEKYDRNNEKRRQKRRNEDGLTDRERKKQEIIKSVKELKSKGLKQIEIAEKLGITKGTVSKYLKL